MKTVLLVDDEYAILETVREILEIEGFRVLLARDGKEALDVLERERPDLIVTDAMMPVLDGIELVRRLRAQPLHAELPVVVISAARALSAQAMAAGATHFLAKPFDIDQLIALLERASSS